MKARVHIVELGVLELHEDNQTSFLACIGLRIAYHGTCAGASLFLGIRDEAVDALGALGLTCCDEGQQQK